MQKSVTALSNTCKIFFSLSPIMELESGGLNRHTLNGHVTPCMCNYKIKLFFRYSCGKQNPEYALSAASSIFFGVM